MRSELDLPPPISRETLELADWAELLMIVEARESLSRTELRARLHEEGWTSLDAAALEDFEGNELESIDDVDELRPEVEAVFRELQIREELAPGFYPFRKTAAGVELVMGRDTVLYEFLLLLSLVNVPFRKETYSGKIERLFDLLALAVCRTYLGTSTGLRFGWPVYSSGRPNTLRAALPWLADEMGLKFNPDVSVRKAGKDAGVDVVAWRSFRDGRGGFSVLLGQCTVARAWEKKSKDIVERLWRALLSLAWDPITVLVIPYCIPVDDMEAWDDAGFSVSMIIDRIRICELLETTDVVAISDMTSIVSWTRSKRQQLELHVPD